jgi:hypothetical protein
VRQIRLGHRDRLQLGHGGVLWQVDDAGAKRLSKTPQKNRKNSKIAPRKNKKINFVG